MRALPPAFSHFILLKENLTEHFQQGSTRAHRQRHHPYTVTRRSTEQNYFHELTSRASTTNNLTEISYISKIRMAREDNSSESIATNSLSRQPIRREPDGTLHTGFNDRQLATTAPIHGDT
jgi:Tfp pilus assembly protein PilV